MDASFFDNLSNNVPVPDNTVLKDGYLHCSECGDIVQTEIEVFGVKKKVRCICQCKRRELDAFKEKEKAEENERKRMVCFAESNMKSWNFKNDDGSNMKISAAMKRYSEGFGDFRKKGEGLLLYGNVGTGKTYYAACIANKLIDDGYSVLMTNFARIANSIQGMFDGKQEYLDSLNRYALLIIDDLGAERSSEYMKETVFNIIDSRYRSGLPMIVTTNLSFEEISSSRDVGYSRIYDRIIERCFPVKVEGISRRRESLKRSYHDMKNQLGL